MPGGGSALCSLAHAPLPPLPHSPALQTLEDPAYSDWYIKFKPEGPWYSDKCDHNYDPPICSDLYHNQEQSPGFPTGDGNCAAPNCDCGVNVPCGF